MEYELAASAFGRAFGWFRDRRRVRVRVHRAVFVDHPQDEYFFINVTNLSRHREVEITHIWFDTEPKVHVLNTQAKLPKRLLSDESWETWERVDRIRDDYRGRAFDLVRVRLSSGRIVGSKRNKKVPEIGTVPGQP